MGQLVTAYLQGNPISLHNHGPMGQLMTAYLQGNPISLHNHGPIGQLMTAYLQGNTMDLIIKSVTGGPRQLLCVRNVCTVSVFT